MLGLLFSAVGLMSADFSFPDGLCFSGLRKVSSIACYITAYCSSVCQISPNTRGPVGFLFPFHTFIFCLDPWRPFFVFCEMQFVLVAVSPHKTVLPFKGVCFSESKAFIPAPRLAKRVSFPSACSFVCGESARRGASLMRLRRV